MNRELALSQGEKHLNECFKNIGIKELESIKIKKENGKVFFEGDANILKAAFMNFENVSILDNEIEIPKGEFKDLTEIIDELNLKIEDFNIYAKKRQPISFF